MILYGRVKNIYMKLAIMMSSILIQYFSYLKGIYRSNKPSSSLLAV